MCCFDPPLKILTSSNQRRILLHLTNALSISSFICGPEGSSRVRSLLPRKDSSDPNRRSSDSRQRCRRAKAEKASKTGAGRWKTARDRAVPGCGCPQPRLRLNCCQTSTAGHDVLKTNVWRPQFSDYNTSVLTYYIANAKHVTVYAVL